MGVKRTRGGRFPNVCFRPHLGHQRSIYYALQNACLKSVVIGGVVGPTAARRNTKANSE
jgi:hypothetical protein